MIAGAKKKSAFFSFGDLSYKSPKDLFSPEPQLFVVRLEPESSNLMKQDHVFLWGLEQSDTSLDSQLLLRTLCLYNEKR